MAEESPRSRALRIEVQIDMPPGGREVRRDQIDEATAEGVRVLAELLADRARVAGKVRWSREFFYTASAHGVGSGEFESTAD